MESESITTVDEPSITCHSPLYISRIVVAQIRIPEQDAAAYKHRSDEDGCGPRENSAPPRRSAAFETSPLALFLFGRIVGPFCSAAGLTRPKSSLFSKAAFFFILLRIKGNVPSLKPSLRFSPSSNRKADPRPRTKSALRTFSLWMIRRNGRFPFPKRPLWAGSSPKSPGQTSRPGLNSCCGRRTPRPVRNEPTRSFPAMLS